MAGIRRGARIDVKCWTQGAEAVAEAVDVLDHPDRNPRETQQVMHALAFTIEYTVNLPPYDSRRAHSLAILGDATYDMASKLINGHPAMGYVSEDTQTRLSECLSAFILDRAMSGD